MSKAIVDPSELRRFAQNLKHFNNELQHQLAVLQGQFAGLGDTWRDQEHERFAQQFADGSPGAGPFHGGLAATNPLSAAQGGADRGISATTLNPHMSQSARVSSIDAIKALHAALCGSDPRREAPCGPKLRFAASSIICMSSSSTGMPGREAAGESRSRAFRSGSCPALHQGERTGYVEQEIALRKAQALLREAEEKVVVVKRGCCICPRPSANMRDRPAAWPGCSMPI